jgi:hypothetical protein
MPVRSGKMGPMRDKTASPTEASRPAAKQRKPRDKGVIALKGPGGLPRTAKRPARGRKQTAAAVTAVETADTRTEPPSPAEPPASELKTMRLQRIKERAVVKRPAVATSPAPEAPPETAAAESGPASTEAPPVAIEMVPADVSPVTIEPPLAAIEPPLAAIEPPLAAIEPPLAAIEPPLAAIEPPLAAIEPATLSLAVPPEQSMSPSSHRRPWSDPTARRRRTSTPVALVARVISTLLRWGGLRR